MPDGTSAVSLKGKKSSLHGCSTFSNYTVLTESRWPKIAPTRRSTRSEYIGCGVDHRQRALINHRKGRGRRPKVVVFGRGGIASSAAGRAHGRCHMKWAFDLTVDPIPTRAAFAWPQVRTMTHFVNPKTLAKRLGPTFVE